MKNLKKSRQTANVFWPSNIHKFKPSVHEAFVDKLVLASQSLKHRWLDKSSGKRTEICRWLIEGLYQSYFALPRSSLAIPLSKDAYSVASPYEMPFSYRAVKDIVDASKETDFIEVVFGTYNPNGKGLVTRLRPKGRLLAHFERVGIKWRQMSPPNKLEGIVLSMKKAGKERRLVERDESPEVAKMQDSLLRINKFLSHQCISLDLPDIAFVSGNFEPDFNHSSVSTADVSSVESFRSASSLQNVFLKRIFAQGSLQKGGRFYGGWWQNVPSRMRKRVTINGYRTIEFDYSGLACAMLYAMEGQALPSDPYDVGLAYSGSDDLRRKIVKRYLNAILNDESGRYRLDPEELAKLGITQNDLHQRIIKLHKPVERYLYSGIGVKLQYLDSQIAERVILRLLRINEVCLPIHDSFIVRVEATLALVSAMKQEFFALFKQEIDMKAVFDFGPMSIATPRILHKYPKGVSALNTILEDHLSNFKICLNFENTWENACFSQDEIALRCFAMNEERALAKDSGYGWLYEHFLCGLPKILPHSHAA